MHEASMHEDNSFITLTYDDAHLPGDGSLRKRDFQLFMKRLRKRFPGRFFRYYHCGEYGDKLARPHYHACIFGLDFPDKEVFKELPDGGYLYTSKILEAAWQHQGFCTVGDVTFESAAYVARYVTKKITGDRAIDHYVDKETGVLREPEYTTMSRRRGIGRDWFDSYSGDVFPWDEVIVNGRVAKPPRFYDGLYQLEDVEGYARMKEQRMEKAKRMAKDCTPERLASREKVKIAQYKMLKRSLENDS